MANYTIYGPGKFGITLTRFSVAIKWPKSENRILGSLTIY